MRVFISSQRVDGDFSKLLIEKLNSSNFVVFHSPRNSIDGYDSRWQDWYKKGFEEELIQVQTFIVVIDKGWDSSTWMAIESDIAYKFLNERKIEKIYFWNPEKIKVKALGMIGYLKNELPTDLDEVLKVLK